MKEYPNFVESVAEIILSIKPADVYSMNTISHNLSNADKSDGFIYDRIYDINGIKIRIMYRKEKIKKFFKDAEFVESYFLEVKDKSGWFRKENHIKKMKEIEDHLSDMQTEWNKNVVIDELKKIKDTNFKAENNPSDFFN